MNFLNDIFQKIAVTITSLFISVTSFLPGVTQDISKPTETLIASPSATIFITPTPTITASPSATGKPILKPKPKLSPSPSPTPSRISVLLVNDGTTVYCLSEWADEVKRASQGVKDAEEALKKISDCINSCSKIYEDGFNDCRKQYPHDADPPPSGYLPCLDKFSKESRDCRNNCPRPSPGDDKAMYDLSSNISKSRKFLGETRSEHCADSK